MSPPSALLLAASFALIFVVLVDAFEAMVLPRRVSRRLRLTRFFYRYSWMPFSAIASRMKNGRRRGTFLSLYGPVSMLVLLAVWAFLLILGFTTIYVACQIDLTGNRRDFLTYFYLSGVTFFTLGFGDVTATGTFGRLIAVCEAGTGFGFLAVIIGYLPVLYQSFSRREINISLLDARAGSPPSAGQLLLRLASAHNLGALNSCLQEWERWSAELLESHLSFPMLCYYRSQHDNQSWLAALTAVLDTCAIVIAMVEAADPYQAEVTFAMGRHAVVDLALVFDTPPEMPKPDRLPPEDLRKLRAALAQAGLAIRENSAAEAKLSELRGIYEPFVAGMGKYFLFPLPQVFVENQPVDNWQTSAWMKRAAGFTRLAAIDPSDEHYE